jgi:hypothetical protein
LARIWARTSAALRRAPWFTRVAFAMLDGQPDATSAGFAGVLG